MEYNVQLNKLSTYIYRGKQPKYATEGIPVINQKAIQWDTFDKSVLKYHDENKKVDKRHFIKKNDVLINSTGTGTVGRVYHINYEPDLMFADSHITIVRTNEELLMSRFLYYQMRTTQFQAMILNEFLAGSTGQVEFNKSMIEKLPINVPSISYQYKVVNILSKLDKKIETNKKIIANLEELSQTLFKRWFVDFEFPDENGNPYKSSGGEMVDSELGEIPKEWSIQTLNDISESYNTKRKPLSKLEREKVTSIYPYYGATKIIDYVDDYLFDGKFILVGEDGTVQTEEGHPFVQYVWGKFWVSNHAHILKGNNLSDETLMLILNNIDIEPYITGAVQPKISKKNLNGIKVIIGTKLIYEKFDQYSDIYYKKIREISEEIKNLIELRDTLLSKLMSGELEIPDDIEVNEDELSI